MPLNQLKFFKKYEWKMLEAVFLVMVVVLAGVAFIAIQIRRTIILKKRIVTFLSLLVFSPPPYLISEVSGFENSPLFLQLLPALLTAFDAPSLTKTTPDVVKYRDLS